MWTVVSNNRVSNWKNYHYAIQDVRYCLRKGESPKLMAEKQLDIKIAIARGDVVYVPRIEKTALIVDVFKDGTYAAHVSGSGTITTLLPHDFDLWELATYNQINPVQ